MNNEGINNNMDRDTNKDMDKDMDRDVDRDMNKRTLCGASSTAMKYFFNEEEFGLLPDSVRDELRAMCVLFTAEYGGIIYLEFDEEGDLMINVTHADDDFLFDEIGAGLKAGALRREHRDLFEKLQLYYRAIAAYRKKAAEEASEQISEATSEKSSEKPLKEANEDCE